MSLRRFTIAVSKNARRLGFESLERRTPLAVAPLGEMDSLGQVDVTSLAHQLQAEPVLAGVDVQQMPSVAVNPQNPQHVVLVAMDRSLVDTGYAGLRAAVSKDGGATWQASVVLLPPDFDQGAANPIVKFDSHGRVFLSYMATTFLGPLSTLTNPHLSRPDLNLPAERALGFQANNGIFISQSDDGGLTWDSAVAITSQTYDGNTQVPFDLMPHLAIDTFSSLPDGTPNPNFGNMYVVFSRYYPSGQFPGQPGSNGGSRILLATSEDHGQTWSLARDANDQIGLPAVPVPNGFGLGQAPPGLGSVNWTHVTIGPEGDIYVSMFNFDAFEVYHSHDGGRTFTPPDLASGSGFPFGTDQNISPASTRGLPTNRFRTQVQRAIVADPTRPGRIYAAEAVKSRDVTGNVLDPADILFSRSSDYGRTWQATTHIGSRAAAVLNDDNEGQKAKGLENDVVSGQALVRLAMDAAGNLGAIWYDTRRDPAGHRLDLFGTVSSDGGESFQPNFRLSSESFDANRGKFIDPTGADNYYLGDFLGLAFGADTAYAAWTNVVDNSQDIWVSRFSITDPPLHPNDRYEPNENKANPTELGAVVTRRIPKLSIDANDEDWFRLQAIATGELTVTGLADPSARGLRIEIWDGNGNQLLRASEELLDSTVVALGQRAIVNCDSGQSFLIRVQSLTAATNYSLDIQALTNNLGIDVYGKVSGSGKKGEDAYYLLQVPADGALVLNATIAGPLSGAFTVEAMNSKTLTVLDSVIIVPNDNEATVETRTQLSIPVSADQLLLLHIKIDDEQTRAFQLTYANVDAYEALQQKVLRFPVGAGASQSRLADINADGALDAVISDPLADVLDVLAGNGDGTFQSPREYQVGASASFLGTDLELPTYRRDLLLADFNHDGHVDALTANFSASDISLILGRGDGTFSGQRRFNATAAPFALASGDVDGDGNLDVVIHDSLRTSNSHGNLAVLLGRGDGTFKPQRVSPSPISTASFWPGIALGKIDGDEVLDLVVVGDLETKGGAVLLGKGDGTFQQSLPLPIIGFGVDLADLNGDGRLDVLSPNKYDNTLQYALNIGQGRFSDPQVIPIGQAPIALAVADLGGPPNSDGNIGLPDGLLDVVVVNSGIAQPSFAGPAEIVLLLGEANESELSGFGEPIRLTMAGIPQDVAIVDIDSDGSQDVVVVDSGSLTVIYGNEPLIPSNDNPGTARHFGATLHLLQPRETIVPGHEDDFYSFVVPIESGTTLPQVVDISVQLKFEDEVGLGVEVRDEHGRLRGSGQRMRIVAEQGERLQVHIFGKSGPALERGTGTYVLAIDVLPQVVSVRGDALLPGVNGKPGGPVSSLVLALQGDRLDSTAATDPKNFQVVFLGPDGLLGTSDDQVLPIASVVYNPDVNANVSSAQSLSTNVTQSITLLFDDALPPGNYSILVSSNVGSALFNARENDQLAFVNLFGVHTLVSVQNQQVFAGAAFEIPGLIDASGPLGDLNLFRSGTRFLTQFHSDLSSIVDDILKESGDQPLTEKVRQFIFDKITPGLGVLGSRPVTMLILFLDPVSLSMVDPNGQRAVYDLQTNELVNNVPKTFVEVGGNVELLVVADAVGEYRLNVQDIPERARGMAVLLGNASENAISLTAAIRGGQQDFVFAMGSRVVVSKSAPPVNFPTGIDAAPTGIRADGTEANDVAMTQVVNSWFQSAAQRPTAEQQSVLHLDVALFRSPHITGSETEGPTARKLWIWFLTLIESMLERVWIPYGN